MKKETKDQVGDKQGGIYVNSPNGNVVGRADRYKAKLVTECIEDGIKTEEEMRAYVGDRGVRTDE